ncbi:MAG: hypothetical protein HY807_09245 [Nitrospirae bacterium]|nr:hypothetical protein [Nitrospirota bacterium]
MHDSIALIKHYIPSMFNIFSPGNTQIKNIKIAYENRLSRIQQSIDKGGVFEVKESLFDLFWDANEADEDACLKLDFIDRTLHSLNASIPANLRSGIGNICYKMIIDMTDNDSKYVTYLAELATINIFLQDGRTTLLSYESKLPNGRPIDFEIQWDGTPCLIEVFTILIDHAKIESTDKLMRFLECRIERKFNHKFHQVKDLPNFIFVPVLWVTNGGNILGYADVARRIREEYNSLFYFMVFGKYYLPGTSRKLYEFVTLENYASK